jgi:hypothetical protein
VGSMEVRVEKKLATERKKRKKGQRSAAKKD